ncbi:MAG: aminoacyl-tRNA hydrolase [Gammaproteobacteria bacterium]
MASIQLIVGLGNPGPEYDRTRHNAGFWFVDALARQRGDSLRNENRFHGETARIERDGLECRLLKPLTFMNRSGQAVSALAKFYRIPPESILVVHDELDLPPGTARLKKGGGHGGHNGLRDIISALGGNGFLRLRIGIGHPGHRDDVVEYVLRKASRQDEGLIEQSIDAALGVVPLLLAGEVERAMHQLHSAR